MARDIESELSEICRRYKNAREVGGEPGVRAWAIAGDRNRVFAFVSTHETSRGVHVRTSEAALLASKRFEPSRTFFLEHGRSNWVRMLSPEPARTEIARLVAKSYALALDRRNFEAVGDVHPILAKALEAAAPETRPPPPYQGGGPTPKLKASGSLRIGIWAAESVRHLALPTELPQIDELLEEARAVPVGSKKSDELKKLAASKRKDSRALGAARRVAGGAASLARGNADMVWSNIAFAAERAVQALREAGDAPAVTRFLSDLDQAIMRAELEAGTEGPKLARVLWRGASDRGLAAFWIVKTTEGDYAIRKKVGGRFAWITGTRDDALANVPDSLFDRAVAIALTSDA